MASYYDDDYPNPCRGVTAGRGHHESDREVAERRRTVPQHTPSNPKTVSIPVRVVLTVSIPVTVGGYTGQRDEWEQIERDYAVTVDGDNVVLQDVRGSTRGKITFSRDGLTAALEVLSRYDEDAKSEPVYP